MGWFMAESIPCDGHSLLLCPRALYWRLLVVLDLEPGRLMKIKHASWFVTIIAFYIVAATNRCDAGMLWVTPAGSVDGAGEPVQAQALVTFATNEIDVTLTNLLVDPRSVAENISALIFTVHDPITGASLFSSSGAERVVNSNAPFSPPPSSIAV